MPHSKLTESPRTPLPFTSDLTEQSLTGHGKGSWVHWIYTYSGLGYFFPEPSSQGSSVCTDDTNTSIKDTDSYSYAHGTTPSHSDLSFSHSTISSPGHTFTKQSIARPSSLYDEPSPPPASSHPIRHRLRRIGAWAVKATVAVGASALLPLPGPIRRTAVSAAVLVVAGRAALRGLTRRLHIHNDSTHPGGVTSADLGLPGAAWLTPDVAARLMTQMNGDMIKASDKAREIHALRDAHGLNVIQFPAHVTAAVLQQQQQNTKAQGARRLGGWLSRGTSQPPCEGSQTQASRTTSQKHSDKVASGPSAAVAAAAGRFSEVSRIVGITLMHVDDERGMACLWIQGARLGYVRKTLQTLLSNEDASSDMSFVETPSSSSSMNVASWLRAITLHVALMSDWLWGTRLPMQPVSAGRFYQVVDLQGVNMSLLGDGMTVLRAIMTAAHAFPQRLQSTIIINPPPGLALAWSVISKLLPAPISAKIRIIRGSGKVVITSLASFLPLDVIPSTVGGPCTLPLDQRDAHRECERAMNQVRVKTTA